MAEFNVDLLKRYIAPCIDEPIGPNLPDLRGESENAEAWFASFFLNSVFTGKFKADMEPYAQSIIARIHFVTESYHAARDAMRRYSSGWRLGNPGWKRYLDAVSHWESVILNLQIVYDLLRKCMEASLGEREQRTHLIANRIKHHSEDIDQGKVSGPGMPVWLSKSGVNAISASVTYDELVGQVRYVVRVASCLSIPSHANKMFDQLDDDSKSGLFG